MTRLLLRLLDWRAARCELAAARWWHWAHAVRTRETREEVARLVESLKRADRFAPPRVGDWP